MNHSRPKILRKALLSFAAASLLATSAFGAAVGIRVSSVMTDDETAEATFDLTVFATDAPVELELGQLLDRTITATYVTVLPDNYGLGSVNYRVVLGARSDLNTYPHPALNFGDGDTLPSATLPLQGSTTISGSNLFAYRLGALSHTYPGGGTYTLRATVGPDGGPLPGLGPASMVDVVTGNGLSGDLTNVFSAYRQVFPTSAPTTPVYSFAGTSVFNYPDTLRYITAQQQLTITDDGVIPDSDFAFDVPTLGTWAMMALATLLAGSGLILLRRN